MTSPWAWAAAWLVGALLWSAVSRRGVGASWTWAHDVWVLVIWPALVAACLWQAVRAYRRARRGG